MTEFGPILDPSEKRPDPLEEIASRTEVIFRDLHDMVSKWGNRHVQREDLFVLNPKDFGVKTEIFVKAKTNPEDLRLIVKRGSDDSLQEVAFPPFTRSGLMPFVMAARQVVRETTSGISYPETLPQILVLYDTDISLEELFTFMAQIMMAGSEKGLVEKEGERIEDPDRKFFIEAKLKVEETFKGPDSYLTILPGDEVSKLLDGFDRPEELVIIEDPYTGSPGIICHKKWEDYHALRFKVANEVFLEMGINPLDLAQTSALDIETFAPLIKRVRDEIESRFKKALALKPASSVGEEHLNEPHNIE